MKTAILGGGPAGLYTAILLKKSFPKTEIDVYERNRADDTFGWGVVFSDETLGAFEEADPETFGQITANFRYWQEIETFFRDEKTVSTGHGFAALGRMKLLLILQERAHELGVRLHFEHEISGATPYLDHDLVVAADGVNSQIRKEFSSTFQPRLDWRRCRFTWLGTDKPLEAFTFIFLETEFGLFQVHAYPFSSDLSTWIVECHEDVWRRAGLENASEDQTVAFCESLCADHLEGYRLLPNRSLWRAFPTIQCRTWRHENLILLGDAAHTAHFSVGSGTKLAMEDAIELVAAFERKGLSNIPDALESYEEHRWVDVVKVQKAAQTSLEWFETSQRYQAQTPLRQAFNLMTRSKRITYDNLRERDPELVASVDRQYRIEEGVGTKDGEATSNKAVPPPMFTPFQLRQLELRNRVVVSPMCQYSAVDGVPNDWHLVHYGGRAQGGAGLLLTEMTDVTAQGRITPGCTGMYTTTQRDAWKRIVDFVHQNTPAAIGIQLAHAGRKGSASHPWDGPDIPLTPEQGAWETIGPSPIPLDSGWPAPRIMTRDDMEAVIAAFVQATRWSQEAGFDLVELHLAHGYLLSSFLSPLCNQRHDEYGGSLENRQRFPLEVFRAVREVWPSEKPISVRVSASDWMPDDSGTTPEETVETARRLHEAGCDIIDVSSGGNSMQSQVAWGRMYQVPFAERVRYEAGIPVMAVGAIQGADHANTVLAAGRTDLVAMARPHLHDPYLTKHAAERYEVWQEPWPGQYLPAQPRAPRASGRRPLEGLSTPGNRGREVEER